jgi:hypothetical protein
MDPHHELKKTLYKKVDKMIKQTEQDYDDITYQIKYLTEHQK